MNITSENVMEILGHKWNISSGIITIIRLEIADNKDITLVMVPRKSCVRHLDGLV